MMMKTTKGLLALSLLLLGLGACEARRETELRTFQLQRMNGEAALALLTPYVREDGTISASGSLITVREQPERLDRIAEVLARYDGAPAQVGVQVYVVEAGDFEGGLAALPGLEPTLRQLLPYRGYRLLDEATFNVLQWSGFSRDGGGPFAIEGHVSEVRHEGQGSAVIEITVVGRTEERLGDRLASTLNAPFGEPVVVASHGGSDGRPALIVVLRADRSLAAPPTGT